MKVSKRLGIMKGAKIMEKIRNTKENVLKLLEAQSKSALIKDRYYIRCPWVKKGWIRVPCWFWKKW